MAGKTDEGKKRKRTADGSSKSSKRVAIEDQNQVKFSLQSAEEWAPVIAQTPGLAISSSIPLKAYTKPRAKTPSRPGRNGNIGSQELLLHSSEHPKLDYIAREETENGTEALLKHYVGVYDPESGKLEVMEARRMIVRGVVRAHQPTVEEASSTSLREQRNILGQEFGTRKAKKALASLTENAISPDKSARNLGPNGTTKITPAAAAMLANMEEATAGMSTRTELEKAADAAKPRPKANLEATEINEVYTIDELIGLDTMKVIPVREWQTTMKNKQEVVVTSKFVALRLAKFQGNVEKLKMLRYLLLLIDFYNSTKEDRSRRVLPRRDELKTILGDMPESVLEGVKRKFAEGSQLPRFKVDLLLAYMAALACVIENFELDPTDLKDDLRLEASKMSTYFKEIGAKESRFPEATRKQLGMDKAVAAQRKIFKLKLPLEFPKMAFARKSK